MTITVAPPSPLSAPAPPGYGRAYATTTVLIQTRGVLLPAAGAQWRPMIPGTDNQYTGPLFGAPDAEAPLYFPQRADAHGTIQVWAPEPIRLELAVWDMGFEPVRQVIDLLFTADEQAEIDLAAHIANPDPHPQYVLSAGDEVTGPLVVQGNLVALDPDPNNVIAWGPSGLLSTGSTIDAYTKVEADERFAPVAHVHDQYATDTDLADATGRISALETALADAVARIATLEAQMVSHIHAAGDWDYLGGASIPDGTPP